MLQHFDDSHYTSNGKPTGGHASGVGIEIHWQDGPLVRDGERIEPNGAFVETVIAIAKARLEYYQTTEFKCYYNRDAIVALDMALGILAQRTREREARGVEGTHDL